MECTLYMACMWKKSNYLGAVNCRQNQDGKLCLWKALHGCSICVIRSTPAHVKKEDRKLNPNQPEKSANNPMIKQA